MNDLIINEPPLLFLPELAKAIGLKEAILLQYIYTVYSGLDKREKSVNIASRDMMAAFPFWNGMVINRIVSSLKRQNIIEVNSIGRRAERTCSYKVNMDALP